MNCEGHGPRPTFEDLLAHLPPDAGLKHLQQLFGYATNREYFTGPRGKIFNSTAKVFNLPNARWLCEAAWIAYEDDREKIILSLRRAGCRDIQIFGNPIAVIVARRRRDLFILFPGTDPLRLSSWLVNLDTRMVTVPGTGFKIHRGFFRHLVDIERRFALSAILAVHSGRVWMTGHSQGGALATLAGLYYSRVRRVVQPGRLCVHAFGTPGALYPERPEHDSPFRIYRITNGLDPVPGFPPRQKRKPAGHPVYIDDEGTLHVGREQAHRQVFAPRAAGVYIIRGKTRICIAAAFLSPLLDHALTGYESRLRAAILKSRPTA